MCGVRCSNTDRRRKITSSARVHGMSCTNTVRRRKITSSARMCCVSCSNTDRRRKITSSARMCTKYMVQLTATMEQTHETQLV